MGTATVLLNLEETFGGNGNNTFELGNFDFKLMMATATILLNLFLMATATVLLNLFEEIYNGNGNNTFKL